MVMATNVRGQGLTLRGYGLYDCHGATGGVGGGALTLDWGIDSTYGLSVGMEYISSNRISANLEGRAMLCGAPGRPHLSLVNRYLWRHYPSIDRQDFTGALELAAGLRHCYMELGLCNRYSAPLIQRSQGGNATLVEPMNVMFALEGWWNDQLVRQRWNVGLRWSNNNDFVIERVANWYFSVKGYYELPRNTYFTAEIGMHPVGSLNLTCSYDGWYMHLGAVRRF